MYEIRVRDRGFNVLETIYPLQAGIQPLTLWWDRRWRAPGQFELIIPAQTPHLGDLSTLAYYLEILDADNGSFEALYLIERIELVTGIVTYTRDLAAHTNAVYAAGQGTGTLRDVVVRIDVDAVDAVSRMESFADARDVDMTEFDLL